MYKSTELLEQRAKLIQNAKVITESAEADARDLTEEEQTSVDGLFGQADELQAQADEAASSERKEKLAQLEASTRSVQPRKVQRFAKPQPSAEEHTEAFRMWCLAGSPETRLSSEQIYKLNELGYNPHSRTLNLRSLSKSTTNAPVPVDVTQEYEAKLKYYFPVLDAITSFKTSDERDLPFSQVDDTSNAAAIVGEAASIPSNVDPSFSKITFKAWKHASPIVQISTELLSDSSINLPSYLGDAFAERFGRAYETAVVSANAGSAAPEGLMNGITVAANLASTNAVTLAKLIDLETSIDIAYRNQPGVGWMMHDATWGKIRQLADDNNFPIFLGNLQDGTQPRLLGYPVFISNQMTSINTPGDNANLILFGAFSKYRWRTCSDRVLTRLDEIFAATGEVGFVMLERADGRYVGHSGCVKALNTYDTP
jgi:HK97 family phage major capsid protein